MIFLFFTPLEPDLAGIKPSTRINLGFEIYHINFESTLFIIVPFSISSVEIFPIMSSILLAGIPEPGFLKDKLFKSNFSPFFIKLFGEN